MKNKSGFRALETEAGKAIGGVKGTIQKEVRHWPALIAVLAVAIVFTILSERLVIGPGWLIFVAILALAIPALIFGLGGKHRLKHYILLVLYFLTTMVEASSIVLLLLSLPDKSIPAPTLLLNAGLLWGTNIVVFALWYWQVEGGGPTERSQESANIYHKQAELIFPQLTMLEQRPEFADWRPSFTDYLFVAFNTSTAFSPTDTPILTTRLKILSMLQSVLSLVTIATLAARAINIL